MEADPEAVLRASCEAILPAGDGVLAAVSGGSDSMALLGAARRVLGARAQVVHVQHGVRAGAAEDARRVQQVCSAWGLPCSVLHAPPTTGSTGRSETALRRRRMAALSRAGRQLGARWVLLAHHADDALETMLLHQLRGHVSDRARAGPPTLRPLGAQLRVLRPFLRGPDPPDRQALRRYRLRLGLPCVTDPSNADRSVLRNRVRWVLAQAPAAQLRALAGLRRRARRRLELRVLDAVTALTRHLHPLGLGCCLDDQALHPQQADAEHVAEVLRLLGACLARPRRLDPRASVVRALLSRTRRRGGWLELPAVPQPLQLRIVAGALHLPHEALADGPALTRVLRALDRMPLYL